MVVEALVFLITGLALIAVFAAGLVASFVALVGAFVDLGFDAGLAFCKMSVISKTGNMSVRTSLDLAGVVDFGVSLTLPAAPISFAVSTVKAIRKSFTFGKVKSPLLSTTRDSIAQPREISGRRLEFVLFLSKLFDSLP